ncbi:hypothetical protein H6G17_12205 [Chroococcidiopsis sp. FACHB-1243]|uniref:hypothetical protein n=1 Tax=Chroococcidiopsis sp. [FACHB-1243] TaxID=2692781 RepID=UPI00177CF528|nr:hypothetical protein [Chroococcidiopsis sp. [FACHB-1243]]MBD2306274.1 hypothetical protein [Chroococcidiopsis sp. [FACHB-1243]]
MVVRKLSEKSTKAEILAAYEEMSKEKTILKSQLDKLAKETLVVQAKPISEPKLAMNQSATVQQRMNSIIDNLGKIQLGVGSAVSELSEQLTTEASKLQEIRCNVATETEQLQTLHSLKKIDDTTLDSLIKSYEDNSKTFSEEFSQRRETLEQGVEIKVKAWNKEQEESKVKIKERNETQAKTRQRETAEYKYNLELQRKLAVEEYEQTQKNIYRELEEFQQTQEKQWTEREKAIAECETQFAEAKSKVEVFPKEKEATLKKAIEEGKGIAHYQAKIKSDLYAKEVEGQKRFYEQRVQSLEQIIQNQEARIQSLAKQLEATSKQVQDLAVKAIEGAANVNSYQTVKEIALEQAKNAQKNK